MTYFYDLHALPTLVGTCRCTSSWRSLDPPATLKPSRQPTSTYGPEGGARDRATAAIA